MAKITPISYQKLVKIFELEGFTVKRQKGDHLILTKPSVSRPVVIKTSPRSDYNLLDKVLKSTLEYRGLPA
jgi:predicted RNA binding protein YcfA (HicA-like mRNA interferase family)